MSICGLYSPPRPSVLRACHPIRTIGGILEPDLSSAGYLVPELTRPAPQAKLKGVALLDSRAVPLGTTGLGVPGEYHIDCQEVTMHEPNQIMNSGKTTRREFFRQTAVTAAAAAPLGGALSALAADDPSAAPKERSRKIKLGLIGCGGRGPWLVDLFKQHGGYDIHAVADYFPEQSEKAGERFGVDKSRRFSGLAGYKRLLASGVEAVVVVNVPRFHAEHGYAAIEAGCHVYAAKPVAIDVPRAPRRRPPASSQRRKGFATWSTIRWAPTPSISKS